MNPSPEFVYIAFDLFPSSKGAATHINHCLKALQNSYSSGLLICLGNDEMPTFQYDQERQLYVYRWKEKIANFLERTQKFQAFVSEVMQLSICKKVQLVHFRDIWGGLPIAHIQNRKFKTVFEVNSFAAIELPNRYPNISGAVLKRIEGYTQFCIDDANAIVTPSILTKSFLSLHYKTPASKVVVIPNGVTILETNPLSQPRTPYILYFGALQKWQGLKTLLKAFKEVEDLNVNLVICSSVPKKNALHLVEIAEELGIGNRLEWYHELDKKQLAEKIKIASLSVAPLSACNRNIVQGCNPLKIIESMGYGTPVVASKIPVVEEIITDKINGFLVPPDRPEILGRKIRALLHNKTTLKEVADSGKTHIYKKYLWSHQEAKMKQLYKNL